MKKRFRRDRVGPMAKGSGTFPDVSYGVLKDNDSCRAAIVTDRDTEAYAAKMAGNSDLPSGITREFCVGQTSAAKKELIGSD